MTKPQTADSTSPITLLLTVSGEDTPGITSALTQILALHSAEILDLTQAVIQKLLSLSLIFQLPTQTPQAEVEIIRELSAKASELKLRIEFKKLNGTDLHPSQVRRPHHYALTLIADHISAQALHQVTAILARWRINIDVIKRLSEAQFSCVELLISSPEQISEIQLKQALLEVAKENQVDIALQAEGLYRRSKRLVVLDMDSTLIQREVIDELARENGVFQEVAALTHQAMLGKMNYDESLRLRCMKLQGLTQSHLDAVYHRIDLTPGAQDLIHVLKKLGYKIAVISGGFDFVADRLKEKLGLDYAYANELEIQNGVLTGQVIPPIVNAQRKADLLESIAQEEQISLDQVIAIGDGANDILMLERAGLGIAFNAKPMVRERADLSYSQKNMRSILYLLGLTGRDVEEAMKGSSTSH